MSPQATARWLPSSRQPRRPASLGFVEAAAIPGGLDPQLSGEIAHLTAEVVVRRGRAQVDRDVIDRLITLVDREGIDMVSGMWADSAATTLPGALWRMYSLREQVRRAPEQITAKYRAGLIAAEVSHAVVGVSEPPVPGDILELIDTVLSGLYTGDFAVALERASAFCAVLATGAAFESERVSPDRSRLLVQGALGFSRVAEELTAAAHLWRVGKLD